MFPSNQCFVLGFFFRYARPQFMGSHLYVSIFNTLHDGSSILSTNIFGSSLLPAEWSRLVNVSTNISGIYWLSCYEKCGRSHFKTSTCIVKRYTKKICILFCFHFQSLHMKQGVWTMEANYWEIYSELFGTHIQTKPLI